MLATTQQRNFATKLKAGAVKKQGDSISKRLGLKRWGGDKVYENEILIRQRGLKWHPGENVHYGKDHTIHSSVEGHVAFTREPYRKRKKVYVHVVPSKH